MMDDFIRDLHHLQKADSLIGKIWLKLFARQFGLFAFAGLIAALGFTMTNIAEFYGLQGPLGPVWAAVVVAIGDFILAAVESRRQRNPEPGPEMAWPWTLARWLSKRSRRMRATSRLRSTRLVRTFGIRRRRLRGLFRIRWTPPCRT